MFIRLQMPHHGEWKQFQRKDYSGNFITPENGEWTLDYSTFYPEDYKYRKISVAPVFDDRLKPGYGNQEILEVVKEDFDCITVKARPGTTWWWQLTIAVPN